MQNNFTQQAATVQADSQASDTRETCKISNIFFNKNNTSIM